jgi:hypothetical protein
METLICDLALPGGHRIFLPGGGGQEQDEENASSRMHYFPIADPFQPGGREGGRKEKRERERERERASERDPYIARSHLL